VTVEPGTIFSPAPPAIEARFCVGMIKGGHGEWTGAATAFVGTLLDGDIG
jgi:hypothetical protein